MGDIALVNNDIAISQFDDISITASEDDDILQQAINNIKTVYGEMLFHPELGNALYSTRRKITDDMTDIINECEIAILQDDRIESVDELIATRSDMPGSVDIRFLITTIYDRTLSSSTSINIM